MIRLEPAGDVLINLYLNGRVRNPEAILKFMAKLCYRCIARMTCRHHAVTRQSGLSRADRPDMQVVNVSYARLLTNKCADLIEIDIRWYCIHRHANGVAKQTPCSKQDDTRNDKTHYGI